MAKASQQSHRKDEHVFLAEKFHDDDRRNDFDHVHFIHNSLPELDIDQVSIGTKLGNDALRSPFYINGMTGGSPRTGKINRQLAEIAALTGIPMASGSQTIALAEPDLADTFKVIRQYNPSGFVLGNIGAGHGVEDAKKAIAMIDANALEIHVNAAQEIVMPEGDREYHWLDNIDQIVHHVDVPIIVKEVGFGMSRESIQQLAEIGVKMIDVSGRGGTNFIKIENERRHEKDFGFMSAWGQSTVQSLLEAHSADTDAQIIASGGVRNPLDIVKSLRLGASAVGVSGEILHSLLHGDPTDTAAMIMSWLGQIQDLLLLLGARNLDELHTKDIYFDPELVNYLQQRDIHL
ncbi:idi protein [Lactobacillus selangorensis]|uniref:Isopentenyl-diphosphate delta-isomerase n=1 Tax=Lactobacillus selangorensis TaxID=81857 RepID=A0A0R2FW42_9LACO|nr:type 2 isopentenyl-diphosphate Delta-isomerase [Lactobacillus selangorensis]KRN29500.1 idi protein [Lactobacillus selangorensis]KRN33970.1 idi protein [Lactobacillus selangorensis]